MAEMSFSDAKILWSIFWHGEELVNKKRRWLMQLTLTDTGEVNLKKFKKPKLLNKLFLPESFVRSDEVSSESVKRDVKRSYTSLGDTEEILHEDGNCILLSDKLKLKSYFSEPSNLKKFHSSLDLLSSDALFLLAKLVTKNKISSKRSRPKLKAVIKDHFPGTLLASGDLASLAQLQQLHKILRNSSNVHGKQPILMTTASSFPLTSIYKALESLDGMPIMALTALNRKLLGKRWVPQFPPSKTGYQKRRLVNIIKERCRKLIEAVHNHNSMPEELVKALSVICLFFEQKKQRYDTLMPKFIFPTETVKRQTDILKALWSLPEITSDQLKNLHSVLGMKSENESVSFQNDLKHYLLQYLFECDELDVPDEVSDVLAILNKSPVYSETRICTEEKIEQETEAVLNVSCQLMKILSYLRSDIDPDDSTSDRLESDDDAQITVFEFTENDYCSTFAKHGYQQKEGFCLNDELETFGDSMPAACFGSAGINSSGDVLPSEAPRIMTPGTVMELKEKQIDKQYFQPELKELMEKFLSSSQQSYEDTRNVPINRLCDEIGFISYKLIGNMLEKFLIVKGRDRDVLTRHHLKGEASPATVFQGTKGSLHASVDDVNIEILIQCTKDLLPSIPKRCLKKVKPICKS